MDILKGKRYDIMNVLWEEGRPLSAFEINDIAPELKMPTVRRCLELLLKEKLIEVAGTSMNGKVYARNYTPLLSREDYLKGNAKSRKITPITARSGEKELGLHNFTNSFPSSDV